MRLKRRHLKDSVKIFIKRTIIFIISAIMLWGAIICIKDINNPDNDKDTSEGKEINKEEYLYKEELLDLGYDVKDVELISTKISNIDVKKYLLTEKYQDISKFISSPYYKVENTMRYQKYYNKHSDYITDNVVIYVEIGLDNEFYTDPVEITNYNSVDALVNKYHRLPAKFEADDLVTLSKEYSSNSHKLKSVAATALMKMIDAAKGEGINLKVISGYRTEGTQNWLYNNSVKKNGIEHALIYSAKPGYSEHQLGLAVDLNDVEEGFEQTKEYKWLKTNSYKYGFIERYPKGKEFITGYGYEPWHYRYLGVDLATKVFTENVTYEEYLVKHSK